MPMPLTTPVVSIIHRQIDDWETVEILKLYTEALEETVNKGSQLLGLACTGAGIERHQYPILTYFRQILECIDAIAVLIKDGVAPSCAIILRSLLEVSLGFEYLLKEDSERRGKVYDFYSYMQLLKHYEKHEPKGPFFKEYAKLYERGYAIEKVPVITDLENKLQQGREFRDDPENADLLKEYNRVKKESGKSFDWYTLYSDQTNDGKLIKNCQQLAIHLKKFDMYEILYREYSKQVHGSYMTMMNMYRSDGYVNLLGLRHLYQAYDIINMTLRISEYSFDRFVNTIPNGIERSEIVWWRQAFNKNFTRQILSKRIQIDEV